MITLFKTVKEIKSRSGEIHFRRFAIIQTRWFSIYVHKIFMADKDEHLHSHPWPFFGIILNGMYNERYKGKDGKQKTRTLKPLSILSGGLRYFHKIDEIVDGPVTTLFFVGKKRNVWFYNVDGRMVDFNLYRKMKHQKEDGRLEYEK